MPCIAGWYDSKLLCRVRRSRRSRCGGVLRHAFASIFGGERALSHGSGTRAARCLPHYGRTIYCEIEHTGEYPSHTSAMYLVPHNFHINYSCLVDDFLSIVILQKLSGGTTAVCALVLSKKLYIAWVGDSMASLVTRGNVKQLVNPHRPTREVSNHDSLFLFFHFSE